MDEYIKRESAMDIVLRTSGDYVAAFPEIRKIHAADVDPVVHGRWVWDSTNDRYFYSRCNKEPSGDCDGGCVSHLSDYCPNCGARMDGDG